MLVHDDNQDKKTITRRDILKAGVLGGLLLPATGVSAVAATRTLMPKGAGAMNISFRNQHTGESFSGIYRVGDRYIPEAFEKINSVLRDFRSGEIFPIDPRIIDIMMAMSSESDHKGPFEVLSGYRSPKTNARLRASSDGVAENSLHMTGQAIDLRMPGFSTRKLYNVAGSLRAGGVGYYRQSNFIHLDTGRVRRWT